MRILHVIQPLPREATIFSLAPALAHSGLAALSALRELVSSAGPDEDHLIVCIGGDRAQALARSAGLLGVTPLAPPLGNPAWSASQFRRLLPALAPLDAAVAWGACARTLAFKLPTETVWLGINMMSGVVQRFDARGAALDAGVSLPWLLGAASPPTDRAAARTRLGLPASQPCLSLLADAFNPASAAECMLTGSVLHAAGMRVSLALPASLPDVSRACRHLQLGTYVREVALTTLAPRVLARAGDVCVIPDGPPFTTGLLLCEALAAECAVVMSREAQRVLRLDVPDFAARSNRATDVARVALTLLEDPARRRINITVYRDALAALHSPTLAQAWPALARTIT